MLGDVAGAGAGAGGRRTEREGWEGKLRWPGGGVVCVDGDGRRQAWWC